VAPDAGLTDPSCRPEREARSESARAKIAI
jgi:hypothetical protein